MLMRMNFSAFLCSSLLVLNTELPKFLIYLFFNNESDKVINIKMSFKPIDENSNIVTYSTLVQPGHQNMEAGKIKNGTYVIEAETNDGLLKFRKTLSIDSDRWFVVNFMQNDSIQIQRKYGYVDTSVLKKIDGKYTGISFYAENRKPLGF